MTSDMDTSRTSDQNNNSNWFSENIAVIQEVLIRRYGIKIDNYLAYKQLPLLLTPEERLQLNIDVDQELTRRGLSTKYEELVMSSRFVDAHRDISGPNDTVQLHSHTFVELLLCLSGDIEYLLGTQRYFVHKGDVLIIAPGVSHQPLHATLRPNEYYERMVIWISRGQVNSCRKLWPKLDWSSFLPASEGGTGKGCCLHTSSHQNQQIQEIFTNICTESEQNLPDWEPIVTGLTIALMVQLERAVTFQRVQGHGQRQPDSRSKELLDQMIEYVEENLNQKITLENTAHQFLISESTLSKTFRSRLNTSFYQFVKQRRLIAAKELLAQNDALSEIPERVGFSDYASFYRAFKKEYDMTPSQYRSLTQNDEEPFRI